MTDKTPAMPEHTIGKHDHPEPHTVCWSELELAAIKRYAESYALATLQAQPAEVSDEEINRIVYEHTKLNPNQADDVELLTYIRNAVRAILAQRPQAEQAQPRIFDARNAQFREENWQIRFDAAVEARRAAQEQLYTERERHTAEVKRLQAEIGRLQSLRPQAVPMTGKQARLLSREELAGCCGGCASNSAIETWMRRAIEKFCEVNGITAPAGGEVE